MDKKAPVIAAIDVGTNSFHMVIASVNTRGMLQIKSKDKVVVRLGESGRDMKYLQPGAIERGVNTIVNFAKIARNEKATIRAVATSAVREALNSPDFLEKVKAEAGVDIEVVSGIEEARLIYFGVLHALPVLSKKTLVIDIGGGSTETAVGKDGGMLYSASEKLGAIRLTKRFFDSEKISVKQANECRSYINGEWYPKLKKILETGYDTVVGTSGTITNIAEMAALHYRKKLPGILNGLTLKREELLGMINIILNAGDTEARSKIEGMDSKRADIIVGGALILEQAIITLNIQKLTLSSYALREGILFDTVGKMKAIEEYPHLTHLRFETVYNVCRKFNVNMQHAEHVRKITLQLFDGLKPLHKLGPIERELLEAASLMHDIGYQVSHDKHHKHSYYIISQSMMPGFSNNESELIANIARYHRKSHPKKKHDNFSKLSPQNQNAVRALSGMLRIAEGIDRRQLQAVDSVSASLNGEEIDITLKPAPDKIIPDIELWGAERRKMLMEETFNREVRFTLENN